MPPRNPAEKAVEKAKNDSGLWLLRVEAEKNETLFRASANYATKGFDETLYRKKQSQKMRHPTSTSGTNNGIISGSGRSEFENHAFGLIPTRYNNFETGRSLTTELPRDRPTSGIKAPSTAGPELIYAKAKLEENKRNYKDSVRREEANINKALGVKTKIIENYDIDLSLQQMEKDQKNVIFNDISIDPARQPLSQLQGMTYYDVGKQPVQSISFSANDADLSKLVSNRKQNQTEIDSHQQLPKASSVLRRYQIFSTRTDANSTGENVVEMMHGKPVEELLPGSKGPQPVVRPTPGQAVIEGRKTLMNANSLVQLGPTEYSTTSNDIYSNKRINTNHTTNENASTISSRPPPGLSQAILQNRLGSTSGLSNGVQLPRGGSGLVVGDLQITHNQIAPSTLIAAKWGRVSSTTYARSPNEFCKLRCEMQPVYYESFIKDLDYSLGEGAYMFIADVSPTVFLVDIGSANEALHGHRASNQQPAPIGQGRTLQHNVQLLQQQQQQEQEHNNNFELGPPSTADSSLDDENKELETKSPSRSGLAIMDIARSGKKGSLDDISASKMRVEKRNKGKKKKKNHISEDEVRRGELRFAMDVGKSKANDLLLGLADNGNDYGITKLFRIGFKIDYNPNPWYVQLALKQKENREKAMKGLQVGAGENEESQEGSTNELPRSLQEDYKPKDTDVFVLPDINVTDAEGNTPLMRAARHGFIDAVVALLREGADYKRKNGRGQTAYDLAKAESNTASIALQMQVPGANERKRRAAKLCQLLDDRTVLVCAQKGDIRRMKFLVENDGHPVDAVNDYGMTPMHFAVIRKDIEMITYLSEKGASITARNNLGQTPLSIALDTADINQEKILRALNSGDAIRAFNAQRDEAEHRAQKQMLSDEKKLVSELKTFTRGTTAAKAIQAAFPMGTTRLPPFGPPDTANSKATSSGSYNQRQVTSLVALTETRPSTARSTTTRTSSPTNRMSLSALQTLRKTKTELLNEGGLVESWNRHVLNYLASQKDQEAVKSAMKARRTRERQESEKAERIMRDTASRNRLARTSSPTSSSRPQTSQSFSFTGGGIDDGNTVSSSSAFGSVRGNRPGSSLGNRLVQNHIDKDIYEAKSQSPTKLSNHTRSSAFNTEDAIKKALADPSSVKESSLRLEPVPNPTSKRFEHWARMRFGVLM
jgi:hypothetical protein